MTVNVGGDYDPGSGPLTGLNKFWQIFIISFLIAVTGYVLVLVGHFNEKSDTRAAQDEDTEE
jgi:hypothetical protein